LIYRAGLRVARGLPSSTLIRQARSMTRKPTFFPWFHYSATAGPQSGLVVAMFAVMQFSVRAYIPGSLDVGGFTLANFKGLFKSIYADAFI
jgi:hypothetical protein